MPQGCFHKYEEHGNPVMPEPASPMFSDEADRFKRDVAGEMRQHKDETFRRQQVRTVGTAATAAASAWLARIFVPVYVF